MSAVPLCVECDEPVTDTVHAWRFDNGTYLCAECTHDAFRSGWDGASE